MFFTNLASDTIKAVASLLRLVLSFKTSGSARKFCTALFTAVPKEDLWKTLATDHLTTVRITAVYSVSRLNFFASPASQSIRIGASSSIALILSSCLWRLFFTELMSRTELVESSRQGVFPTFSYRQGCQACLRPLFHIYMWPLSLVQCSIAEVELA